MAARYLNSGRNASSGYKRDRKQTIPGRKWSEAAKTGEEASKRAWTKRENQKTPSVPKVEKKESKSIPSVKSQANSQAINEINAYRDSLRKNTRAVTPEETMKRNSFKRYQGQSISNSKPVDSTTAKMDSYINAGKLTKDQIKEARALIKQEQANRRQAMKSGDTQSLSNAMIPGTDEYNRYQKELELNAKVNHATARGALLPFLKATNAVVKGAEKITNTQNTKGAKDLNKQIESAMNMSDLAAEQSPIKHGIGNFAGNAALYSATNPIFDTAAEGLGITSAAGKFIANQVAQNAQDVVLDTLPEYQRLKDKGLSDAEIRSEIGKNLAWNAGGNLAMPFIGKGISKAWEKSGAGEALGNAIRRLGVQDAVNKVVEKTQPNIPSLTKADMKTNRFNGQPTIISQLGDSAQTDNAARVIRENTQNALNTPVDSNVRTGISKTIDQARIDLDNFTRANIEAAQNGTIDWQKALRDVSDITHKYESDANYDTILDDAITAMETLNNAATKRVDIPVDNEALRNIDNGYEWVDPSSANKVSVKGLLDSLRSDLDNVPQDIHPTTRKNVDYLKGSIDRLENAYKSGENFNEAYEDYRKALNRVNDNMAKKEGNISWKVNNRTLLNPDNPDNIANRFKRLSSADNFDDADLPFNDEPLFTEGTTNGSSNPRVEGSDETNNATNMKVSDAYNNSLKNSGILTDEELAKNTVPENFTFESHTEEQTMAEGARMRAEEGDDFVPNRLNKEGFTASDTDGMMQAYRDKVAEARALDEAGLDSTEAWEEANTIFRKVQTEASRNAQAMQALAKWSRNTPEGMLSEAEHIVNKRIKVEGAKDGKTKQVADAINKSIDKAAVEKQRPVLTQAAEAYTSFADRLTKSIDTSEYKGRQSRIQKLYDAIGNFEKAVNEGNIKQIEQTYNIMKGRANSMAKKGLSIDINNKDIDDAINILAKNSRSGGFEFSPDFQKTFIDEASKIQDLDPNSREFKEAYARLGQMVNDEIRRNTSIPKRIGQGITSYLMNNMLGNFRTLITRNAGGNLGLALTEQLLERPLATGIDKLVAKKITGVRTQTTSWKALKEYAEGFAKGISEELQDVKSGLHTSRSGEVNLKDAISRNVDVFKTDSKNKLLKGFTGLLRLKNQVVAHGLSVGDRPFYEAIYNQTLGDMNRMKEKGLLGNAIQGLSDADYKTLSEGVAQYNALVAVYQNDSKMSDALMKFKSAIGEMSEGALGFDILSQFSMPFVKTPANVIDRAIDYSPLGFVRNAARTGKETIGKNKSGFNQNRFVNETARNIIGTGLMAGAGAAAYNGVMSGKYSNDKDEKAAQREAGEQEYALNLPNDYQMDIGWVPVLGSNSVAAAAAVDAADSPDMSRSDKVLAGLSGGGKAMFDQSMFQGLQRLFGSGDTYNSDNGLVDNMIDTVKGGATQAIPSLARQIGQVIDPYERDLNNGNYDRNSIINNIPILRETLQPKVDSEGNYIEQNQGRGIVSKIWENMILPGRVTQINQRELNAEAQRLQSMTGNNTAYEPKPQKSEITTDTHVPTDEEFTQYQVDRNKAMTEVGKALIASQYYQEAPSTEEEDMLAEMYQGIRDYTSSKYTGKELSKKVGKAYGNGGVDAAVNAVIKSNMLKYAGVNDNSKISERIEKELSSNNVAGASEIMRDTHILTEAGLKPKAADAYQEAKKSVKGLTPQQYIAMVTEADTDKNGSVTQEEIIDAMNKNKASAKTYQDALWTSESSKPKKVDGQYKATSTKSGKSKGKTEGKSAKENNKDRIKELNGGGDIQSQLASYGAIDSETTVKYYNHAKQTIPSLTPKGYVQKLHEIGGNDYKITQKEMLSYANNKGLSEDDMSKYWNAYGQWKRIPYLSGGTWKAK